MPKMSLSLVLALMLLVLAFIRGSEKRVSPGSDLPKYVLGAKHGTNTHTHTHKYTTPSPPVWRSGPKVFTKLAFSGLRNIASTLNLWVRGCGRIGNHKFFLRYRCNPGVAAPKTSSRSNRTAVSTHAVHHNKTHRSCLTEEVVRQYSTQY